MIYYPEKTTHCPSCNGTSWLVGRIAAECGTCHTALPLAESHQQHARYTSVRGRKGQYSRWREVA